jgi:hypothetical protein
VLPDFETTGEVTTELVWSGSADGGFAAEGALSFSGGLASDDASTVVAGVEGESSIDLKLVDGELSASGEGSVWGFEVLYGELYADYRDRPATVAFELSSQQTDAGRILRLGTDVGIGGGATEVRSHIQRTVPDELDYSVAVRVNDLGATLRDAVQDPLQGSVPGIADLRAEGRIEGDFEGRIRGSAHHLDGRIVVENTSASTPAGSYGVETLELTLPFRLLWQDGELVDSTLEQAVTGSLAFERIRLDGLEIPDTHATLSVVDDTIYFGRQVDFGFLSGLVSLEGPVLEQLLRPERRLTSAVRLDGLQLADWSRAMDWIPLEGEAQGYFPTVRVTPGQLSTQGEGRVALFGGELVFEDISGEDLFNRFPRFEFSARFHDIDLGALTHTFDFGSMTGRVKGYARDVELFGSVPVRFSARIESVATAGVPQRVSIKAVNNLTMVGAGDRVSAFDRGIYRFFDSYKYKKLGLQLLMKQDRFLLRGLHQRGDRELILVGKPPRRLDIVNARPGRTVSFQTMLDRISHLDVRRGGEGGDAPYTD